MTTINVRCESCDAKATASVQEAVSDKGGFVYTKPIFYCANGHPEREMVQEVQES